MKPRLVRARFLLASIGAFVGGALPADTGAAEISLAQVVRRAREWRAPAADTVSVDARIAYRQSRYRLLPTVDAEYSTGKSILPRPASPWQREQSLKMTIPLVDASAWTAIAARKREAIAAACDAETEVLTEVRVAIDRFVAWLGFLEERDILRRRAARMGNVVKFLKEATGLRLIGKADLLSARAEQAETDAELELNSSRIAEAESLLRASLGLGPTEALEPSRKQDFVPSAGANSERSEWTENLPSILSARHRLQGAERELASAHLSHFPTISGAIGYDRATFGDGLGETESLNAAVTVSFPIFAQGVSKTRIDAASARIPAYDRQLSAERLRVQAEVRSLLTTRKSVGRAFDSATTQRDLAEKAFQSAWNSLSLGKQDYLTIQTAEDRALSAERQWLSLRRDLLAVNATLFALGDSARRNAGARGIDVACQPIDGE